MKRTLFAKGYTNRAFKILISRFSFVLVISSIVVLIDSGSGAASATPWKGKIKMDIVEDAIIQKKKVLEMGTYCVKFGLTKADLEEVLHAKRMKELHKSEKKQKED